MASGSPDDVQLGPSYGDSKERLLGLKGYERFNSTGSTDAPGFLTKRLRPTRLFVSVSIVSIVTGISALLVVFVAVPAYMQYLTWKNSIVIDSISIISPDETSFTSSVVERFSADCPVSATATMQNDLVLTWQHDGGGDLVKLTGSNSIPVSTSPATLSSTAQVVNSTAFANFNAYAINADWVEWRIQGHATVNAGVKSTVSVDKVVRLRGFSGFSVPPLVHSLNVTGGTSTELVAELEAQLTSSSTIQLLLGKDLIFSVFSNDVYVGYGMIANASLLSGSFSVVSDTHMTYTSGTERSELMALLSNYSNGFDTNVTLANFRTEPLITWLQPALNSISMAAVFPGMADRFIQSSILYAPRNPLKGVDFTIDLYNPQHCDVTITGMVALIFYEDTEIGSVTQASGMTINIPAGGRITSPMLHADPHAAGVKAYSDLVNAGFGYVDIISLTYLSIESFNTELDLRQDAIPTTVVQAN